MWAWLGCYSIALVAPAARGGECIPEVCHFCFLLFHWEAAGALCGTMPSFAIAYPFLSFGTVWLWAENKAEPSGEEWTAQKW